MKPISKRILFLGKKNDPAAMRAEAKLREFFSQVESYFGNFGDRFPAELSDWSGDYILSYLCPWVVPENLLNAASAGALNFHPGPPEFPGIGCTNFAVYEEKPEFGVTCHFMVSRVDSGEIIAVRRFPVSKADSVFEVTKHCYAAIEKLFYEILEILRSGSPLPRSEETWTRAPYTRKELNALCRLTPDLSETEMLRRIRAVTFPGKPGAYLELGGKKFHLSEEI